VPGEQPAVSVIIPVRRINGYVRESLSHLLAHDYAALEVIILPDCTTEDDGVGTSSRVRIVPTGAVGPAEKRDRGASLATGEILAFLDDDAYPHPDWLAKAIPHFLAKDVAAVGGPAVTPPDDPFWQQASGWALSTRLGSGGALMRYLPVGTPRDVDDWPTVNLLVRKTDFEAVGGFNCHYYPGEDTKLCLDLTRRLGKRIIYEPGAIVYHHRRDLFWGHFRQIGRYAEHRGYFVKAFPATSRRPLYFLPTALVAGLVGGALGALAPWRAPRTAYALALGAYGAALGITCLELVRQTRRPVLAAAATLGVALTHVVYGVLFVKGLLSRELVR
jgi:cellulose synthase/poly-beta-1,6-N-acetylglucosamine synthase-like glycosyltransferase